MNNSAIKNMAIILLFSIAVFSMVRFVSELKAKYRLQDSLVQAQGELVVLNQEKQNLLQELGKEQKVKEQLALSNTKLRDYLRASKHKIVRLFQDSSRIQSKLEDTSAKLSILKAENRALIDSRKRIYLENEQFKVKFSSVVELKKAIRELRTRKLEPFVLESAGNQGFLLKDGQPTVQEKIKIEVVPASYKSPGDSTGPAQIKE